MGVPAVTHSGEAPKLRHYWPARTLNFGVAFIGPVILFAWWNHHHWDYDKLAPLMATLLATFLSIDVFIRGDIEAARGAHQDLTTGDVAKARDSLSRAAYRPRPHGAGEGPGGCSQSGEQGWKRIVTFRHVSDAQPSKGSSIRDQHLVSEWFTLLWALERVSAAKKRIDLSLFINADAKRYYQQLVLPQLCLIDAEFERMRNAVLDANPDLRDDESSHPGGGSFIRAQSFLEEAIRGTKRSSRRRRREEVDGASAETAGAV